MEIFKVKDLREAFEVRVVEAFKTFNEDSPLKFVLVQHDSEIYVIHTMNSSVVSICSFYMIEDSSTDETFALITYLKERVLTYLCKQTDFSDTDILFMMRRFLESISKYEDT